MCHNLSNIMKLDSVHPQYNITFHDEIVTGKYFIQEFLTLHVYCNINHMTRHMYVTALSLVLDY